MAQSPVVTGLALCMVPKAGLEIFWYRFDFNVFFMIRLMFIAPDIAPYSSLNPGNVPYRLSTTQTMPREKKFKWSRTLLYVLITTSRQLELLLQKPLQWRPLPYT